MTYQTTQVFRTQCYITRELINSEWYSKIISLRKEIIKIEEQITLSNEENNIELLREKIRKILLEIENLQEQDIYNKEKADYERIDNK
jgi:hypothetical protein